MRVRLGNWRRSEYAATMLTPARVEESVRSLPLNVLAFSALAAAVGLFSASAAPAPAPQKLIPLKVAYDGYSMTSAPLNYAVQKGIFRKHGLDVTITYVDAGTTLTQAVVGGSVGIAQNGYTPAAAAAYRAPTSSSSAASRTSSPSNSW